MLLPKIVIFLVKLQIRCYLKKVNRNALNNKEKKIHKYIILLSIIHMSNGHIGESLLSSFIIALHFIMV